MIGRSYSTGIPLLKEVVEHVYIVAYKEETKELEKSFLKEGFEYTVIRPKYTKEEKKYSPIIRCLLNHTNAWKRCTEHKGLVIVTEADFVPVVGFADLPIPFDIRYKDTTWGWLYACGPVLYELRKKVFARGHSAAPVATLLGSNVARILLDFATIELENHDPHEYSLWDTYIRMYAQKKRGVISYIPFRHYGEHGGMPNPEHKKAGLTSTHRADVLYGRLHFLPDYAQGSKKRFLVIRAYAKLRGIGRVLLGRYLEKPTLRKTKGIKHKLYLCKYGISRLLSIY